MRTRDVLMESMKSHEESRTMSWREKITLTEEKLTFPYFFLRGHENLMADFRTQRSQ